MSFDQLDFKESCKLLMQNKQDDLLLEFNEKKQYHSISQAYPDKKEAHKKFKQFKEAGLIDKSWRRSTGHLVTSDRRGYRKRWREANKDKMLLYTRKWLNKKFAL